MARMSKARWMAIQERNERWKAEDDKREKTERLLLITLFPVLWIVSFYLYFEMWTSKTPEVLSSFWFVFVVGFIPFMTIPMLIFMVYFCKSFFITMLLTIPIVVMIANPIATDLAEFAETNNQWCRENGQFQITEDRPDGICYELNTFSDILPIFIPIAAIGGVGGGVAKSITRVGGTYQ